jgi:hypothetical protein
MLLQIVEQSLCLCVRARVAAYFLRQLGVAADALALVVEGTVVRVAQLEGDGPHAVFAETAHDEIVG